MSPLAWIGIALVALWAVAWVGFKIPPGLTLTTQIVLGMLVGPIGLAVATPLAAASVVLVRMLYVEDVLGDRVLEV